MYRGKMLKWSNAARARVKLRKAVKVFVMVKRWVRRFRRRQYLIHNSMSLTQAALITQRCLDVCVCLCACVTCIFKCIFFAMPTCLQPWGLDGSSR